MFLVLNVLDFFRISVCVFFCFQIISQRPKGIKRELKKELIQGHSGHYSYPLKYIFKTFTFVGPESL